MCLCNNITNKIISRTNLGCGTEDSLLQDGGDFGSPLRARDVQLARGHRHRRSGDLRHLNITKTHITISHFINRASSYLHFDRGTKGP